jgi:hypothetical protein
MTSFTKMAGGRPVVVGGGWVVVFGKGGAPSIGPSHSYPITSIDRQSNRKIANRMHTRTKEHGDDGPARETRQEDQHQVMEPRVLRVGPHAHGGAQGEGHEAELCVGGFGCRRLSFGRDRMVRLLD